MQRIIILITFSIIFTGLAYSQSTTFQPKQFSNEAKGLVYDKELSFDLRLHTNGWAIATNIGRIKSYYKTKYYHIEIGELKHPKEHRHSFDYPNQFSNRTSKSFVFGKENNLYAIRAGVGIKRYYSEKAKRKGVAVGISYEGGPTLGLLKPYYLDFWRTEDGDPTNIYLVSEKYDGTNANTFLDNNSIYGASGFTKGFSEIRPIPGLHGKISVHFDWGAFDQYVKAFEAGIMVDVFLKKTPIMVSEVEFAENRPYFINLYLTLQLGKRW
jgi:hypothetical protein